MVVCVYLPWLIEVEEPSEDLDQSAGDGGGLSPRPLSTSSSSSLMSQGLTLVAVDSDATKVEPRSDNLSIGPSATHL